jgi:hypothetical protein
MLDGNGFKENEEFAGKEIVIERLTAAGLLHWLIRSQSMTIMVAWLALLMSLLI